MVEGEAEVEGGAEEVAEEEAVVVAGVKREQQPVLF